MNIQKIIPALLLVSGISVLQGCSCNSTTGTPGSHRDTAEVKAARTLDDGTPGSHRDTTTLTIPTPPKPKSLRKN